MVTRSLVGIYCLLTVAVGQVPDVRLKFDVGIYGSLKSDGHSAFHTYDPLGRPSTVSLTFFLESGLRAYAAQRFERVTGSGNTDLLDELYIEDEGIWRVGKQYLPFGYGRLMAETAIAARGESSIVVDGVPIVLGFCDNGKGYQQGWVARIGRPGLNLYWANGRSFGISGTALAPFRRPEDASGVNRGYRTVIGLESSRKVGLGVFTAAVVTLRQPISPLDSDLVVTDVAFVTRKIGVFTGQAGITYGSSPSAWLLRLGGSVGLDARTSVEPMIRFRNGGFYDLSVGIRFRF